jgi:hypothetical protein
VGLGVGLDGYGKSGFHWGSNPGPSNPQSLESSPIKMSPSTDYSTFWSKLLAPSSALMEAAGYSESPGSSHAKSKHPR